jgi:hypothetical protein
MGFSNPNRVRHRPSRHIVGNSPALDILGARTSDLARTAWLKVPASEEYADVTPDHTISLLHELPAPLLGPTNL